MAEFEWDKRTERAAELIAAGDLKYNEIAAEVGIEPRTLWNWRHNPEFAARVNELLDDFRTEARRRGLAVLERRVAAQNDRWTRMRRLLEARADSMADVPGGSTGLLVRRYKSVGSGENARVVEEYEFDAALFREVREHEKQSAQELGQWTEKREINAAVAVTLPRLSTLTDEDLATLRQLAAKLDGGPESAPSGD